MWNQESGICQMTSAEYWEGRNRAQAAEWLDEVGIGRPVKKHGFSDYALLAIVHGGIAFFWANVILELSK
jgi:hypothetical protein